MYFKIEQLFGKQAFAKQLFAKMELFYFSIFFQYNGISKFFPLYRQIAPIQQLLTVSQTCTNPRIFWNSIGELDKTYI